MTTDLGDIKRTLAQIPNPLAVLESLFALAPVGFQLYDKTGRSLVVNQAFRDLFGSEPPPEYNVLQDDIARKTGFLDLIHRAFAGETVTLPKTWYDPRELEAVKVERGNRVAIVTTLVPLLDGEGRVSHVAVVFRDVTAESLAHDALEAERELLSTVVDHTADGILVCDDQGVLRIVNEAARKIGVRKTGVPMEQWQTTFGLERADGSPLPLTEMPLYRAFRGEASQGLVFLRRPDGRRAIVSSGVPLRFKDGRIRGAVVTIRDETERLRREEDAERNALFRERFIGILGHDLRSPLTAIAANAGLILRQPGLSKPVSAAAARTEATAMRMGRMISDLLDFTQARLGGGLNVQRKPANLGDVARAAIDEAAAAHPGRSAALHVEGDAGGAFDADRITQLVSNLVNNAFAYSPPSADVDVFVRGLAEGVEIAIKNHGPPIPAAELPTLFDPFRRGSGAGGARGLGLGLYIVQQIAVAHGGSVAVSSDSEATVFRVRLQR